MKSNLLSAINLYPEDGFQGYGPLGNPGSSNTSINLFSKIISSAIGLITIIAAIWFVFLVITGALGIMSSGGDKVKAQSARARIASGVTGLVVVVAGIFIVDFIGGLIGLDILNVGEAIQSIKISK